MSSPLVKITARALWRMVMTAALFRAMPSAASLPPARNSLESPVSVEAGYRAPGRLLVVLAASEERNHPELASSNRVFFGDEHDLWQLDASVPEDLAAVETELAFFRGIKAGQELSGGLTLAQATAHVECGGRGSTPEELSRLSESEQADVEHRLAGGEVHLHPLPLVLEPLYLFTQAEERKSPDLVLVEAPIFNFHGDYDVRIGPRAHLVPTPVASDFHTWRSEHPGEIHFVGGGGLYVPLTIDLLPKADREHRGSPTLIRGASGSLERLELPPPSARARATIEGLGFGRPIFAKLHTPCEGAGSLAQIAPRPR